MSTHGLRKLTAAGAFVALNALLLNVSPGQSAHPDGICQNWGAGHPCTCEPAMGGSETNCHLDGDCEGKTTCEGGLE